MADDLGELAELPATPPRWRFTWLGGVGLGLVVALAAAVLVQARQFALLRSAVSNGDEIVLPLVHHTESDYLRLREQWRAATDERLALDGAALRQLYAAWVGRVEGLLGERPQRLIQTQADHVLTLQALSVFIAQANAGLGRQPSTALDRAFVMRLWPALEALDPAIRRLFHGASVRVAEQVEERTRAVA